MDEKKKAYKKPELIEWGTVTELTAAGGTKGSSDITSMFSVTPKKKP